MDQIRADFIELFKASGWSQAEAARRLEMTRGGINGIITGGKSPSLATVKLLRLLLARDGINAPAVSYSAEPMHDSPGEPTAQQEVDDLVAELDKVPVELRGQTAQTLRQMVRLINKKQS